TANINLRARSYLHSNCSNCHRANGPTPVNIDLHFATAFAATRTCNIPPVAGDLGISNAQLIAPGEPARSVLLERMKVRNLYQMPPLGSHLVDEDGVALIAQWISSLESCQ